MALNRNEVIFKLFLEHNANPKTELNYTTDFQLLVAVVLSAQSQDKVVNLVTSQLFRQVKKPSDLLLFSLSSLELVIQRLGLFRMKAKNLLKTAEILVKDFNDSLPNSKEELQKLPGVGMKSAAVLANALFGSSTIAVDTHVFRVSNRLGLVYTEDPQKTETALLKVVPKWAITRAHHWLVLHGRYICKAKAMDCENCFLNNLCPYYKNILA